MKSLFKLLVVLAILIALPTWVYAQITPNKVCATADFGKFISQFINLTENQQYTCVKYPVNDAMSSNFNRRFNVREIKNEEQLKTFLGHGNKIVSTPKEVGNASRPFVSAVDKQGLTKIQANRLGYTYKSHPEGMGLALTEGGTYIWSELRFARINGFWLLTNASGFLDDDTNDDINN